MAVKTIVGRVKDLLLFILTYQLIIHSKFNSSNF